MYSVEYCACNVQYDVLDIKRGENEIVRFFILARKSIIALACIALLLASVSVSVSEQSLKKH